MTDLKSTVVAYRCPYCGKGVISNEGFLALTAEKLALRCPCKRSEAIFSYEKNDLLKITVPCLFCPKPHTYSLQRSVLADKDLFTLQCPYTGSGTVFFGDLDHVRAELDRTELEILNAMDEHGVESFEQLHKKSDEIDSDAFDTIMYVIGELDEENKIYCNCKSPSKNYEISVENGGIILRCADCGASKFIPADSSMAAHAFIEADSVTLE